MSNPVVTVKNDARIDIFVSGQPDWDDQILIINGKKMRGTYTLKNGKMISLSVNWESRAEEEMIGVVFATSTFGGTGPSLYLAIGQDPNTGNLTVTDEAAYGQLPFRYAVSDQAAWSMTISFTDA